MNMSIHERFAVTVQPYIKPHASYGLAVSGGGDSVALVHLMHSAYPQATFHILHINHNLREEAYHEAACVESIAKTYSYPYHYCVWKDVQESIQANNTLQAARNFRHTFYARIASEHSFAAILTAHTQTDIVENTLMRLGRGSGLTGLAAMPTEQQLTTHNLRLIRPLLNFSREELRAYLTDNTYPWCDDPTNENRNYLRPRVRQLLPVLEDNGLAVSAIADAAQALRRAEDALANIAHHLFATHMLYNDNEHTLRFPFKELFNAEEDLQLRLLGHIIRQLIPGTTLLPRTKKRLELLSKLRRNEPATLGGVKFTPHSAQLICTREGE